MDKHNIMRVVLWETTWRKNVWMLFFLCIQKNPQVVGFQTTGLSRSRKIFGSKQFITVSWFTFSKVPSKTTFEALREKYQYLANCMKFCSNSTFWKLDFFPGKVWLCSVQKWALQWVSHKLLRTARSSFSFRIISGFFLIFEKNIPKLFENWKMTGPFWAVWEILIAKLILNATQPYIARKKSRPKILFFHGEITFPKCGILTEFHVICQVLILFRPGLHLLQDSLCYGPLFRSFLKESPPYS